MEVLYARIQAPPFSWSKLWPSRVEWSLDAFWRSVHKPSSTSFSPQLPSMVSDHAGMVDVILAHTFGI